MRLCYTHIAHIAHPPPYVSASLLSLSILCPVRLTRCLLCVKLPPCALAQTQQLLSGLDSDMIRAQLLTEAGITHVGDKAAILVSLAAEQE